MPCDEHGLSVVEHEPKCLIFKIHKYRQVDWETQQENDLPLIRADTKGLLVFVSFVRLKHVRKLGKQKQSMSSLGFVKHEHVPLEQCFFGHRSKCNPRKEVVILLIYRQWINWTKSYFGYNRLNALVYSMIDDREHLMDRYLSSSRSIDCRGPSKRSGRDSFRMIDHERRCYLLIVRMWTIFHLLNALLRSDKIDLLYQ